MDFAWLVYMGMKFGYREKDVAHMYLHKWSGLFTVYKRVHNMEMKGGLYREEPEKSSILNI